MLSVMDELRSGRPRNAAVLKVRMTRLMLKPEDSDPPIPAEEEQRQAVRQRFDKESSSWGDRYDRPASTLSQLDVTARLAVANRMVKAADRTTSPHPFVLDLGCGTGEGTSRIYAEGMTVIAADLSTEMVRTAVRRFPFLQGCVADAAGLPFESERFDIVQSLGVLEYIGPYGRALRELRRVLTPGGTLVISFPNRHSLFRRLRRLERFMTAPLRRLRARRKGDTGWEVQQWSPAEMVRLLQASGFNVVDMNFITYGVLLPAADSWRANLALCRWLNARCRGRGVFCRNFAITAVFQARAV
jgi:ubiquinone/menaquinone biosynthesis C-methylase UbiE